jgi:hypothetical protein
MEYMDFKPQTSCKEKSMKKLIISLFAGVVLLSSCKVDNRKTEVTPTPDTEVEVDQTDKDAKKR